MAETHGSTVIDFERAAIAQRIKVNYAGEQADDAQAATLAERKQARRKAIAEDLALVHAHPPPEGFVAWVKVNCPFSVPVAYRYMGEFIVTINPPEAETKNRGGRPRGPAVRRLGPEALIRERLGKQPIPKGVNLDELNRKTASPRGDLRRQVEAEFGQPQPKTFAVPSAEADGYHAAFLRVVEKRNPTAAVQLAQAEVDEVIEKVKESDRERFTRLLEKAREAEIKKLQAQFHAQVRKEVEERSKVEHQRLLDQIDKHNAEIEKMVDRRQSFDYWMTQEDFRLVLGCLHPDHPDRTPERLRKAFDIFNRLQKHLGTNKKELVQHGW